MFSTVIGVVDDMGASIKAAIGRVAKCLNIAPDWRRHFTSGN
jgi:hypothetical protein